MSGRTHRLGVVLGAAVCAMFLFSSSATGMGNPHVTAKIDQNTFQLVPDSAREGKVKFDIDNTVAGSRMMIILRVNDVAKIPLLPDGTIDTSKVSIADTVKDLGPGRFRAVTPNLVAGTYIVASTTGTESPEGKITHHFTPGMAAKLTLRPFKARTTTP